MAKYLTKEGLQKFKKELNDLVKNKRKEVSERIGRAASYGDLKENAAYDTAKEEQGFIEARIRQLREIVFQAKIIGRKKGNKVEIGSLVYLKSNEGEEKFQIVGPEEADISKNRISFESPLGGAILNKKKGDIAEVNTLDGKKEYKIIGIE